MDQYQKFKHLLEYFVAHLEYCVTDNKGNRGYSQYIQNITNFKRGGQGHKGQNIQSQIEAWERYANGSICININPTVYKGKGCYLNWEDTAINVNADWEKNKNTIIGLKIVKDSYPITNSKDVLSKNIGELGLFDTEVPNKELKSFFDKYNYLIMAQNQMEKIQPYTKLLEEVHNLILTGAPGTGKTYLAKQIAKQLIGAKTDEMLEQSGQFAFVQFHPSYDYTDFVEGLRPTKLDVHGNIGFELKDGIFKRFCKKAIGMSAITTGHIENFTLDDFDKYLLSLGLQEITVKTYRHRMEQLLGKEINAKRAIKNAVKYSSLEEICENADDIKDFDTINNFHNQFSSGVAHLTNFREELASKQHKAKEIQPFFVFIIDEINRGEISKIFGELFFAIDPSYRGKKGTVKTQFSNLHDNENELFYVPENVYIIGCMNDIDRSVESFDFAMRRRFTWQKISAPESADNMNLSDEIKGKMARLNKAISKIEGLNDDYHIGGAYFLDKKGNPRTDYDEIWKYRLEPLLREYLRGIPNADKKLATLKTDYDHENKNNG
ncbi:MAG: hypothetical protein RIS64_2128 [Bacteroidota bacterium]